LQSTQRADPRSILSLYRRLIALRRSTPALSVGTYRGLHADNDILVYERAAGDRRLIVALNLTHGERMLPETVARARVVLSTHLDRHAEPARSVRADEGLVLEPVKETE
jgi:alpha-glucosidase